MEEMILQVCVVVFSMLYIQDHTVFQEQEENIVVDMREWEYLLQKEAAKLEQEVHPVATGLPHSNQEVLQSHRRSTNGEGEDSDGQLNGKGENPDEPQMLHREDQDVLHQKPPIKGVQDDGVPVDENFPSSEGEEPEIVRASQDEIREDRTSSHSGILNQMPSEDDPQMPVKKNAEEIIKEKPTISSQHPTENPYIWYLWKCLSVISFIHFLRKFFSKGSQSSGTISPVKDKTTSRSTGILSKIFIPDNQVMSCFYDQCVRTPASARSRVCEFVEGFVDELLEAARDVSNEESDIQIGDFIGVGSLYELWATGKTTVCDLYIPITAPRSYGFDVELWKEKDAALLGFGRIKLVKAENTSNGCPCMDGNPDDEDMLCLLHPHSETSKVMTSALGGPLCQENTPYLSKKQIVRQFRTMIIKAWSEISHKYEFELGFRSQMAPGAMRVRFRSGQIVLFNITPVVQIKASKAYLVSYLPANQNISDIHWPISFASYERALFQYFNKTLPFDSCHIECLQILSFLHKQQNTLTGKCGLTSYHLKSTLLHLLMYKPTEWKREQLASRLADMLTFLERRLGAKELRHALVGNSLVPKDIGLPREFQIAKATNIFLPLASDEECYLKTVHHLQELVKNAPVFIQEYGSINTS